MFALPGAEEGRPTAVYHAPALDCGGGRRSVGVISELDDLQGAIRALCEVFRPPVSDCASRLHARAVAFSCPPVVRSKPGVGPRPWKDSLWPSTPCASWEGRSLYRGCRTASTTVYPPCVGICPCNSGLILGSRVSVLPERGSWPRWRTVHGELWVHLLMRAPISGLLSRAPIFRMHLRWRHGGSMLTLPRVSRG